MRIKFQLFLTLILLIFIVIGCDDGNVDNSEFVNVKSESVNEPINSLYLEWNSGVINITKGDTQTVQIDEKAKEDFQESNMFSYELNGSQLKILDPHYQHPVIMLEHDLDIIIPDKKYDEININGTSVEINMEDFEAVNLNLNCNTTEHNISGMFDNVNSEFTSGEINYNFKTLPQKVNLKGYVSNGQMILPEDSEFYLKQNLIDSELNDSFDLEKISDTEFTSENPKSDITISLEQSSFNIDK